MQAAQLIGLETKLMVGTLKCRRQMPSLEEDYNAFEAKHGDFLKTQYPIVIGRFIREEDGSPGGWRNAYDRYRTVTANVYSGAPAAPEPGECARAASLARVAGRVSGDELRLLAESIADSRPAIACGPVEADYAPQTMPARASGVATWQPPERELPPRSTPSAGPAMAAPPVTVPVASAPVAPSPAAPSQVSSSEALAAAVVALQAATAALQVAAAQAK
ncbi:MAG TPA: hypothetical protein VFS49_12605 [Croceibacterium sp.]|nr:hypothetical protein [Croceibacterium sp.]